ncbi:hypothetical protein [Streptomyces mirabilis]|uniref:hypothetical protein n=1 Tax=Streptomyces mirabilis TaxID=68239 RepID=UPI003684B7E0
MLNLQRGCVERNKAGLWLMKGLYFKGAEDEDGNKVPEGKIRPDPWVVIETVTRAIAVLERLHPNTLLFPALIKHTVEFANGVLPRTQPLAPR